MARFGELYNGEINEKPLLLKYSMSEIKSLKMKKGDEYLRKGKRRLHFSFINGNPLK